MLIVEGKPIIDTANLLILTRCSTLAILHCIYYAIQRRETKQPETKNCSKSSCQGAKRICGQSIIWRRIWPISGFIFLASNPICWEALFMTQRLLLDHHSPHGSVACSLFPNHLSFSTLSARKSEPLIPLSYKTELSCAIVFTLSPVHLWSTDLSFTLCSDTGLFLQANLHGLSFLL